MHPVVRLSLQSALCLAVCFAIGCSGGARPAAQSIEFTVVPEAAEGGSEKLSAIEGRVTGARPGQRIVLFAKSVVWWVQPYGNQPFTDIGADGTWKNTTHLGAEYAALLVDDSYRPPSTLEQLPAPGGSVAAVATVKGPGEIVRKPRKALTFSGYEWEVRQTPSDRGGANLYDGANAWTDAEGFLHLRLAQREGRWTSAEVALTRSLGYGTYLFVVRDTSQMEPAAALSMLTWDDQAFDQNHRELDIEISRWGNPLSNNAQYVVQPYYVAANVARFSAPAGRLTHSFRWEPGRATFRTVRGAVSGAGGPMVAQHEFTSGVPVPGNELVRMNLYYFRFSPTPVRKDVEVVIERFQYLP
jgi:hypothetical protein